MSAAAMSEPPTTTGRGERVELIPGRPPFRLDDGRVAVPLWLLRHERHVRDLELRLSPQGATEFANRLRGVLATGGPR